MRISRPDSFKKDFAQLPGLFNSFSIRNVGFSCRTLSTHPSELRNYRDLKTDGKVALICSTASPLKFMRTIIFLDESAHMIMFLEVLN
jgi:hypothetical protein